LQLTFLTVFELIYCSAVNTHIRQCILAIDN